MPSTPKDMPFDITLASPNGTRHLAFDNATGRWYRLWQNRAPVASSWTNAHPPAHSPLIH